jgi:hypothetical protein
MLQFTTDFGREADSRAPGELSISTKKGDDWWDKTRNRKRKFLVPQNNLMFTETVFPFPHPVI